MLAFSQANAETFYEVKHFLKQHKTYSANRDDLIYIVRDDQKLIGTARLLGIEGATSALWLRGLFISPKFRHQGIASQLLSYIRQQQLKESTEKIFAFVEPHLHDFYIGNNYQLIDNAMLPEALQQRLNRAQQHNKKWLCFAIDTC